MSPDTPSGLEAVFLASRPQLLRFLRAHGAGEAAEDLLQELWIRVAAQPAGPLAQPLAYLYRAANNLMVDQARSRRQAERRDRAWTEATGGEGEWSDTPGAERAVLAREELARAQAELDALGTRAATVFRRYRLDGAAQRDIARELGVSLSTVESDLRRAYRALIEWRRTHAD
jgi:RNA polymerase sigma factor (sigma-70 family)